MDSKLISYMEKLLGGVYDNLQEKQGPVNKIGTVAYNLSLYKTLLRGGRSIDFCVAPNNPCDPEDKSGLVTVSPQLQNAVNIPTTTVFFKNRKIILEGRNNVSLPSEGANNTPLVDSLDSFYCALCVRDTTTKTSGGENVSGDFVFRVGPVVRNEEPSIPEVPDNEIPVSLIKVTGGGPIVNNLYYDLGHTYSYSYINDDLILSLFPVFDKKENESLGRNNVSDLSEIFNSINAYTVSKYGVDFRSYCKIMGHQLSKSFRKLYSIIFKRDISITLCSLYKGENASQDRSYQSSGLYFPDNIEVVINATAPNGTQATEVNITAVTDKWSWVTHKSNPDSNTLFVEDVSSLNIRTGPNSNDNIVVFNSGDVWEAFSVSSISTSDNKIEVVGNLGSEIYPWSKIYKAFRYKVTINPGNYSGVINLGTSNDKYINALIHDIYPKNHDTINVVVRNV